MDNDRDTILIELKNVTVRVRDKHILQNTSWQIRIHENWVVLGPNGSGKTSLVQSLIDEYTIVAGSLIKSPALTSPRSIGYVSFEQQQSLYDHGEMRKRSHETFSSEEVLGINHSSKENPEIQKILRTVQIEDLLQKNMSYLSTGETRRVLIGRALCKKPELLILDEPFEGLDPDGRLSFEKLIDSIIKHHETSIILVTHRLGHIPKGMTHVLMLNDNKIHKSCRIEEADFAVNAPVNHRTKSSGNKKKSAGLPGETIVKMENLTVSFSGTEIISDFSWNVKKGENWVITGANGTGKSTILRLIYGDLTQGYGRKLILFGKPKGSGESLWDIRKKIGYISTELHMDYRKNVPAEEVILSGIYDSVGLFHHPSAEEAEKSREWLKFLGLAGRGPSPLQQFSFGEQRLILLARSLIKEPPLLILDEPLQGMDPWNRKKFVNVIETAALAGKTQIILVSHHIEEVPESFDKHLHLEKQKGVFSYSIEDFS